MSSFLDQIATLLLRGDESGTREASGGDARQGGQGDEAMRTNRIPTPTRRGGAA